MTHRTNTVDSGKKTAAIEHDATYQQLIEQLALRIEENEPLDLEVYLERYPRYAEKLRRTIPAMQAMFELGLDSNRGGRGKGRRAEAFTGMLGAYQIICEIGRGGMGVVYEAEEISLGRRVALKILPLAGMLDSRRRQRFQNEARAAATLEHPHIVPVYGVGQERGVHYFAMKLVHGRSFAELIAELRQEAQPPGGSLPMAPQRSAAADTAVGAEECSEEELARSGPAGQVSGTRARSPLTSERSDSPTRFFRSVARLGVQAAEGLAYAHSLGVTHRDIKPANLLLDENGNCWIADFGLAQMDNQAPLTGTGGLLGTLGYMSPEQVLGQSGQVDGRADVYGLGITLYELLTLQPAFADDNRERILRRVLEEDPPSPRELNPAIPRDLETIVLKAIDKDLTRRFGTADELAEDLQRFLKDEPVRARRPGLWERIIRWCRRHQQATVLTAAFMLLLIGVLATAAVWIDYERQRAVVNMNLAQHAAERQSLLRQAAEQSEERAQQLLYLADIKLASQAWRAGNLLQYEKLLDRHRPTGGQGDFRDFAWHYLWGRGNVAHQELPAHEDQVWCVRVSADGQRIASAGTDGRIRLADSDGRPQGVINAGGEANASVHGIAFSPDRRELISAGSDGYLRRWDVESGDQLWAVPAHHPGGPHYRVAFSSDGTLVASSGSDPEIHLWDAASGAPKAVLRGHQDAIFGLATSPDAPLLASVSRDRTVRLWDLRSGRELHALNGHTGRLTSVAFSPDGETLASGATDRAIYLWDVPTGKKLSVLEHLDEVGSVGFSGDGRWLAVGDRNRSIHLWRLETDGEAHSPEQVSPQWNAHDERVRSIAFLPDGRLLSGGRDGRVKLWNPFSDRTRWFVDLNGDSTVNDAVFTPDGRFLLLAGKRGLYVWDVAAETVTAKLRPDVQGPPSIAVAPDGETVAVTDSGGSVEIWHLPSRSRIAGGQFGGQNSNLGRPSFSPDGHLLAVPNGIEDTLWIVDAVSGRPLAELPARQCHDAIFSADGREVAVDTMDDIVIWDWAARRRVRRLRGHHSSINDLAPSPDRRLLASASNDRQVKVWDWASGKQRCSFTGHQDRVYALAFSADGRLLMSGGRRGSLYGWHISSGLQICELERFSPLQVKSLSFTPDGNRLVCVLNRANVVLLRGKPTQP